MLKSEYIKDFAKRSNIPLNQAKRILESVYFHLLETTNKNESIITPIGKIEKLSKNNKNTLTLTINSKTKEVLNE